MFLTTELSCPTGYPMSDDSIELDLTQAFDQIHPSEQADPSRSKIPIDSEFSVNGSARQSLEKTIASVPRVVLRDLDQDRDDHDRNHEAPDQDDPLVGPQSAELPVGSSNGRYQLFGEIARGGMGAVLKGRDTDLGRDLAIKVLLDGHKDRPDIIQRFIEEAQIGGQLQHPGIAPVYELGKFADQRLFFSMKLVKGKTLSALLRNREDHATDRAKFIGIFEQICQTMAYAHSRGVIHRDLKPANIMVGAFGEVQVMDWGLAKVFAPGGVADENRSDERSRDHHPEPSLIQTMRSGGSKTPEMFGSAGSETAMGIVIGTPAYMPPEQALGEIDRLDERSDVFGLGAILCVILTGEPPYVGKDGTDVYRLAARGKLDACFERLHASAAGDDLIAITRHCLEREPEDRPRDAGAVAAMISAHLESVESRLREAENQRIAEAARVVEERKRGKLTRMLGALAAAFVALAGIGAFVIQKNRNAIATAQYQNEIAEIQRKQEKATQAERAIRVTTDELAQAELLLDQASGVADPAPVVFEQLRDSARRAHASIPPGLDAPELRQRSQSIIDQSARLDEVADLIDDLEEIRILELEPPEDQQMRFVHRSDGPPRSFSIADRLVTEIEQRYRKWFPTLDKNPREFARQINDLPGWAKSTAIDSLQYWRHQYDKSNRRFEHAQKSDWVPTQVIAARSLGGATMQTLDDHSILVAGKNPPTDRYVLELATPLRRFNAIRLEALTHPSLPNFGPGRSDNGDAVVTVTNLVWKSGSAESVVRPIAADADYHFQTHPNNQLRVLDWSLVLGSGTDHAKVFYLESPIELPSDGDVSDALATGPEATAPETIHPGRLHLSLIGNSSANWSDQNLGRFRVSIAEILPLTAGDRRDWFDDVLSNIDQSSWVRQMWSAINRDDIYALTELADEVFQDDGSTMEVSEVDLVRLANLLWTRGESAYLTRLRDQYQWRDLESATTWTDRDAFNGRPDLVQQDDGRFVQQGEWPGLQSLKLSFPFARQAVTGIYLETDRKPTPFQSSNVGNLIQNVDTAIRSLRVSRSDRSQRTKTMESFPLPISKLVTQHARMNGHGPESATDDDRGTFWYHPKSPQAGPKGSVMMIQDRPRVEAGSEVVIEIETGDNTAAYQRILPHFRIQFTTDPLVDCVDPREVAGTLLRQAYAKDPGSIRILLAMSQMTSSADEDDRRLAISFASSAMSLRPDSKNCLAVFRDAVLAGQPAPRDHWLQLLMKIADEFPETERSATHRRIASQQIRRAEGFLQTNKWRSRSSYLLAAELSPKSFSPVSHRLLAETLVEAGELEKATKHTLLALQGDVDDEWAWCNLARIRFRENRLDRQLAYRYFAHKISGHDTFLEWWACNSLMSLKRYQELIDNVDRLEKARHCGASEMWLRGLAHLQTGHLARGLADVESASANQPANVDMFLDRLAARRINDPDYDPTDDCQAWLASRNEAEGNSLASKTVQLDGRQLFGRAPLVQSVDHRLVIARSLAKLNSDSSTHWQNAFLAALHARQWNVADEALQQIIRIDDVSETTRKTCQALMRYHTDGVAECADVLASLAEDVSEIDRGSDSATTHLIGTDEDELWLQAIRQRLLGVLASDPSEEARELTTKLFAHPDYLRPSDFYGNRILAGWMLAADANDVAKLQDRLGDRVGKDDELHYQRIVDHDWLSGWFWTCRKEGRRALSVLSPALKTKPSDLTNMLFLAKAAADADEIELASEAAFQSRLLIDREWDREGKNENWPLDIQWALGHYERELKTLESILPPYEPPFPERELLERAKAKLANAPSKK